MELSKSLNLILVSTTQRKNHINVLMMAQIASVKVEFIWV